MIEPGIKKKSQLISSVITEPGISLAQGVESGADWHASTTGGETLNYAYCGWGLQPDALQSDGQTDVVSTERATRGRQSPAEEYFHWFN